MQMIPIARALANDAIDREREAQDVMWGTIYDNPHEVGQWLHLIQEELDEAVDAYQDCRTLGTIMEEIVHAAATCVACLEQYLPRVGAEDE